MINYSSIHVMDVCYSSLSFLIKEIELTKINGMYTRVYAVYMYIQRTTILYSWKVSRSKTSRMDHQLTFHGLIFKD